MARRLEGAEREPALHELLAIPLVLIAAELGLFAYFASWLSAG